MGYDEASDFRKSFVSPTKKSVIHAGEVRNKTS